MRLLQDAVYFASKTVQYTAIAFFTLGIVYVFSMFFIAVAQAF